MLTSLIRVLVLAGAISIAPGAFAQSAYPVSGTWTYDNASESGATKRCGPRQMKFEGFVRFDTQTAVPEYRNLSIEKTGATTWHIVDQVYTVVALGKVYYTLRLVDNDHITISLDRGGANWLLRRCV